MIEVDEEGYRYDAETGEVLGHVDETEDKFRIVSAEAADWALGLMFEEEARLQAIEARRSALLANLERMAVEPRNRLAWLHRRFDGELIDQARRDLDAGGNRSKTAKYPHGTVACRAVAGSSEILDQALALEYAEEWAPNVVKKSVAIQGVREAIAAEERAVDDPQQRTDTRRFYRAASPSERWTISTGLGKDPRK